MKYEEVQVRSVYFYRHVLEKYTDSLFIRPLIQ